MVGELIRKVCLSTPRSDPTGPMSFSSMCNSPEVNARAGPEQFRRTTKDSAIDRQAPTKT